MTENLKTILSIGTQEGVGVDYSENSDNGKITRKNRKKS